MKFASYWMETCPAIAPRATGFAPRYDVAIVGGGFTGLSAARVLAKAGKRVAVLEAQAFGAGASGRNGGHLNNGMAHGFGAAVARFGMDCARGLYQSYDAAIDLVEAVIEAEGIACDFRRSGKLKIASKPGHVAPLRAEFERIHHAVDPDTTFLGREDLSGEIVTDAAHGGMLYAKSASMHMGRYLHGLAVAAERHGADLFDHCPVTARAAEAGGWRLETPLGPLQTHDLIVATGACSGLVPGLFPAFERRLAPVGSFILATRPLSPEEVAATVPGRRTYVNSLNIGSYFRLAPDDRLIFGGRARFSARSDPTSDAASARILRRTMGAMFPSLGGIEADYCFGGLVDITRDRLPRAGRMDNLWYAMGYSGHGAQMANLMGARIGQCVLGEGENPLGFLDWPPIPGHFGKPWFLPVTGLYFRLKDLMQ